MNIFVENQFNNLGIVTRISRVLLAKAVAFFIAYSTVNLGVFMSGAWAALPLLLIIYLLLSGLTGWDPLTALDNRIKRTALKELPTGNASAAIH